VLHCIGGSHSRYFVSDPERSRTPGHWESNTILQSRHIAHRGIITEWQRSLRGMRILASPSGHPGEASHPLVPAPDWPKFASRLVALQNFECRLQWFPWQPWATWSVANILFAAPRLRIPGHAFPRSGGSGQSATSGGGRNTYTGVGKATPHPPIFAATCILHFCAQWAGHASFVPTPPPVGSGQERPARQFLALV
jgi:hypothetical protein